MKHDSILNLASVLLILLLCMPTAFGQQEIPPATPETQPATPETPPATPETQPATPETQPATPETPPATPQRLAFVMGNSQYKTVSRLQYPAQDSQNMKAMLEKLGFQVVFYENTLYQEMNQALSQLAQEATGKIIVFYYAGHIVQMEGENYLLPVDVMVNNSVVLKRSSIRLHRVMEAIENGTTKIIILESCRNIPVANHSGRKIVLQQGLTSLETIGETAIILPAEPGKIVQEPPTIRNSMLTDCLIEWMSKENLTLLDCLKNVKRVVREKTKGKQVIWWTSSIETDFSLNPK